MRIYGTADQAGQYCLYWPQTQQNQTDFNTEYIEFLRHILLFNTIFLSISMKQKWHGAVGIQNPQKSTKDAK